MIRNATPLTSTPKRSMRFPSARARDSVQSANSILDPLSAAAAVIERCEREISPLAERLEALTTRLASIDAELTQTTTTRAEALLSGTSTLTLGAIIRELTDERAALSDVLARLSGQIVAKRAEQGAARAELALLEARQRAAEARARAARAKVACATALREFVRKTFPALMIELRASTVAAREACAAVDESWPGDLFDSAAQANLAFHLEHAAAGDGTYLDAGTTG